MKVLDLIPRWVLQLAVAGLCALAGWQTLALHAEAAAHAKTRADHSEQVAQAALATADSEREQRRIESRRASLAQEIANDRLRLDASHRAAVASLRRDADGLRQQLADFAARPSDAGSDPEAACLARAATLGDLLAESVRLQVELAGAAESHLADARSLHRWAQQLSTDP
jgi:hypothetical protein